MRGDWAYLVLDGFVVGLLQPGPQDDTVVNVAHGAQHGGGRIGRVVGQRELSHQLPQQRPKRSYTQPTAVSNHQGSQHVHRYKALQAALTKSHINFTVFTGYNRQSFRYNSMRTLSCIIPTHCY